MSLLLARIAAAHRGTGLPYYDTVMADTPLLYWRLDETTGTTAADASGNGKAGTYATDASTLTAAGLLGHDDDPGIVATSSFHGVTSAANVINTAADWTIECLIKPTVAPASIGVVVIAGYAANSPEISVLPQSGGTTFKVRVMVSGTSQLLASVATRSYGQRVHVMLTYTAATKTVRLYIDGAFDSSTVMSGYTAQTGATILGYDPRDANYSFIGNLDEFSLYQAALSATRVAAHYSASL